MKKLKQFMNLKIKKIYKYMIKKVAVIRHGVGENLKGFKYPNNIYKEINNINDYDFHFLFVQRS